MPSSIYSSNESPARFRGLNLVAGHPALDLVNTVKYRGTNDPQDRLGGFGDLVDWAVTAGLISESEVTGLTRAPNGESLLRKALNVRESLWCLFNRGVVTDKAYARALGAIEKAIAGLRPRPVIDPRTGALHQHVELHKPADLIARIVDSVADLLTHRETHLIKTCDGCDCDWLFVDRTKARRRRWCDTRTCGNIARARDFRQRQKTQSGPASSF